MEAFDRAVAKGTRLRSGAPGPALLAAVGRLPAGGRAQPGLQAAHREGRDPLPQPLARHPRAPSTSSCCTTSSPPAAGITPTSPGRSEGYELSKVAAQGATLGAGAGEGAGYEVDGTIMRIRLPKPLAPGGTRRPRVRLPHPDSARWRAPRRPGRRGLLHQLLVPPDGGVRRRERLADRPVLRERRVLHGLRQLRRRPHRAGGVAGDEHRHADERGGGALRARPGRGWTPR